MKVLLLSCSTGEAARCADRLIYDRAAADRMRAAQRHGVPQDGAGRIVRRMELLAGLSH